VKPPAEEPETPGNICQQQFPAIRQSLLAWGKDHYRPFVWRLPNDPYHILIAEKLLQQTAARDFVEDAYARLIDLFPTPAALAEASEEALREAFAPLGLQYRAVELKRIGVTIVELHSGQVPEDLPELLALLGVGDYMARAVLCFGFGHQVPIVDTNIARVLYRIFGIPGRFPSNPARKKSLIALARILLPENEAIPFNYAILDFAALVCIPRQPHCGECSLVGICRHQPDGASA
jgi:A/G-specific adenine glycosylase